MIDIALSNYNSQGIQDLLENNHKELLAFSIGMPIEDVPFLKVRALVAYVLSEHFNIAQAE